MVFRVVGLLLVGTLLPVLADDRLTSKWTDGEIARETSDPSSDLWYLYTLIATTFQPGETFREAGSLALELQPSLPVPVGSGWRALNFPDMILAVQGTPEGGMVTGVESLSWITALSPDTKILGLTVGVGPAVSFPVSTDPAFGPAEWQFGIGGVVVRRTESLVTSALVKSVWTTSGAGGGFLQVQYNIQYFLGNGWQVGLGRPRVEYTWDADGRGVWDLPVGFDVGRALKIGSLPIKFVLEYEFFAVNDSRWAPEHMIRLMIIPVMDNPF